MGEADEDEQLRSVALQNAKTILAARERAESELLKTKDALQHRTEELARTLAMMRATLESTTDAILVTDAMGSVLDFNENFIDLWRLPREMMSNSNHRQLVEHIAVHMVDPVGFREQIEHIYAGSRAKSFQVLELADGRVFEWVSRVLLIGTEAVGRVWSLRDITPYRRTEEALRRAAEERAISFEIERAARVEVERVSIMKDEFLATLSHELRTPLNAVLGWAELLLDGEQQPEDIRRGLETIARNARAQAQLIEDLLDMSRIVSGKVRLDVQRIHLGSIVEAALDGVKPSADAKAIAITKIIDPIAGPVFGDPNRLQQIVWNLLSNAVKFTPKGGKVSVLVSRVNSHIEISVVDSGHGISAEFLPHVFERFRQADASTTRKHGGLGLGLAIVKQLVELHGGSVRAESVGVGQGATFVVSLPLTAIREEPRHEHPAGGRPVAPRREHLQLAGIKVLVVDDEPDARELLRSLLVTTNAEVVVAGSAELALALLQTHLPHVLISDIGMPDKDGYQLIHEIRALAANAGGKTPAIALTAFARSEDRTRAMLAGYQIHLSKPIEPRELIATVASLVGRTTPR